MKIIALLLARNEEAILPTYLSSIKNVVDEIVAINDRSTDATKEILQAAGAKVFESQESLPGTWNEFAARQRLLELGRAEGGTHFVCLDADEALSGNFLTSATQIISQLKPGQKLVFSWPFLWKDAHHFVDDSACEFTNLKKDFIFCDHPDYNFKEAFLHFGKTPGPNNPENLVTVAPEQGVVLHFAYEDFNAALLRQAWYRCMELIKQPKNFVKINNRYYLPKQGEGFKTRQVPEQWLQNIVPPEKNQPLESMWRFKVILGWFEQYGAEFFEPLEIWNIPELRREFFSRVGREPKSSRLHIYLRPFILLRRKFLS